MGKRRVFAGFSEVGGFVTFTSRVGLARAVGVSVKTLERRLGKGGGIEMVKGKGGGVWWVGEVELGMVERGGKGGGFPGGRRTVGKGGFKAMEV